jgi:hypothetical protein
MTVGEMLEETLHTLETPLQWRWHPIPKEIRHIQELKAAWDRLTPIGYRFVEKTNAG